MITISKAIWARRGLPGLPAALIAGLLVLGAPDATRADVKDIITSLYGGDGISLDPTVSAAHAPHFNADSLLGLDNLSDNVTSSVTELAFNSAVTGFTFDVETGVPVRTTESLGPLLAERATTLGARKIHLGLSYTRVEFSSFEGTGLGDLELTFSHDPSGTNFDDDFIEVDVDLNITEDVMALFSTYGVTESLDVGVVVPFIRIEAKAVASATIIKDPELDGGTGVHQFGGTAPDKPTSSTSEDATGIGDVILRAKYHFLTARDSLPDVAARGLVKFATGDEDNLLGTGETDFQGLLIVSRQFESLNPHMNVGYEFTTGPSSDENLLYVVGVDAKISPTLTAAVDVLGRWHPDGDGTNDTIDIAFGTKWSAFNAFVVNANFQVPLNPDTGLRADIIWSLGIEFTF